MLFSWDNAKNTANKRKHGISFDAAKLVFDDPFLVSLQDSVERGEMRWQTIGSAGGIVLILVAHTWREEESGEEHIRIISARRATKAERKIYEENT